MISICQNTLFKRFQQHASNPFSPVLIPHGNAIQAILLLRQSCFSRPTVSYANDFFVYRNQETSFRTVCRFLTYRLRLTPGKIFFHQLKKIGFIFFRETLNLQCPFHCVDLTFLLLIRLNKRLTILFEIPPIAPWNTFSLCRNL